MRRHVVAVAGLVLGAVVTTGCSPPKAPLEVGVKDVPTDVVIGKADETATTTTVINGPAVTSPAGAVPGVQAGPGAAGQVP